MEVSEVIFNYFNYSGIDLRNYLFCLPVHLDKESNVVLSSGVHQMCKSKLH